MLILAAGGRDVPMDYKELERWMRVGYERGTAAARGERQQSPFRRAVLLGALVWAAGKLPRAGPEMGTRKEPVRT